MKTRYLLQISIMAALFFGACNKWLDVTPKYTTDDDKLFASYDGYRSALNGIYQSISGANLYGRNMTWGTASVLGQDYKSGTSSGTGIYYNYIRQYRYTNSTVLGYFSSMWSTAYNAIANCNKLLTEIEKTDDDFFEYGKLERELIKGEALALRGMLHFDMARFFAPAPASGDDTPYVPYYDQFPQLAAPKLRTSELLAKATADMLKAKDLIAPFDTLKNPAGLMAVNQRVRSASIPWNGEYFFSIRGERLNFVAVNGLLARMYLWAGNEAMAKEYAGFVIDTYLTDDSRLNWFEFSPTSKITTSTVENRWIKMYGDILFCLYDRDLLENIRQFKGTSIPMALNPDHFDFAGMSDNDDARASLIITEGSYKISQRWIDTGQTSTSSETFIQYRLLPVLRLSEMYYIKSECLCNEGDITKAARLLNVVRNGRGAKRRVSYNVTPEEFKSELLWEVRKEYMTEGQTWFYYKRLNEPRIQTVKLPSTDAYVIPLPDAENFF